MVGKKVFLTVGLPQSQFVGEFLFLNLWTFGANKFCLWGRGVGSSIIDSSTIPPPWFLHDSSSVIPPS